MNSVMAMRRLPTAVRRSVLLRRTRPLSQMSGGKDSNDGRPPPLKLPSIESVKVYYEGTLEDYDVLRDGGEMDWLQRIRAHAVLGMARDFDRNFRLVDFVEGSKGAFQAVHTALSVADTDALGRMCTPVLATALLDSLLQLREAGFLVDTGGNVGDGHTLRHAAVLGCSLRFMREAFDESQEPAWRSGGLAISVMFLSDTQRRCMGASTTDGALSFSVPVAELERGEAGRPVSVKSREIWQTTAVFESPLTPEDDELDWTLTEFRPVISQDLERAS